jgi:lipopolysaccharide transport system ATP-binding protein
MSIVFREVTAAGVIGLSGEVPDGAIVGLIGEDSPGLAAPLRLAAGLLAPDFGTVEAGEPRRHLGLDDALNLAPVSTLTLEHALARHDALVHARARIGLERLRRSGAAILLLSHQQDLLRDLCDEIWWMQDGRLQAKGEPREVLAAFNGHVALRLRDWAASVSATLAPSMRRGDGRARLLSVTPLDAAGRPAVVWRSGDPAGVRVTVQFLQPVDDPVVGIMIRTRIGIEVYGTNTELEGVKLGPRAAGDTLAVTYSFRCDLCPQEYTLTAASHDPDGVWHDWLEDAVALTVTDSRYTAGVANLRAAVTVTAVTPGAG